MSDSDDEDDITLSRGPTHTHTTSLRVASTPTEVSHPIGGGRTPLADSVSKGVIAGIVIGVLTLLSILWVTAVCLRRRRNAAPLSGTDVHENMSRTSHIYGTSAAPVQSNSDSMPRRNGSQVPTPHSPVTLVAPSQDIALSNHRNVNSNASSQVPTTSRAPLSSPEKKSEHAYFGGDKYALIWDDAPARRTSGLPPSSSLQPPPFYGEIRSETDTKSVPGSVLPPSYTQRWTQYDPV
ncbi:hypothetical protein DFH09DRAFT_1139928 [Mycena vulgaris]|nr:hypothetical protein DFH09DRAFT_1139928 [Mycena vulgaris]